MVVKKYIVAKFYAVVLGFIGKNFSTINQLLFYLGPLISKGHWQKGYDVSLHFWIWAMFWSSWLVMRGQLGASQVALVVKNLPANAGDIRGPALIPRLGRSPGEGDGTPLQYSCLENPVDRGAWWATVHGVTQSQTWLKWLSTCTWEKTAEEWPSVLWGNQKDRFTSSRYSQLYLLRNTNS